MAVPAYDVAKLSKNLVEKYGYEREKADGLVSTTHEMVEGAAKTLADKEFVEAQFRSQKEYIDVKIEAQKEYIDGKLESQKEYIDGKLEAQKEYIDGKLEAMSKEVAAHTEQLKRLTSIAEKQTSDIAELRSDMRVMYWRFVYIAIAAVALVKGLDWLFDSLGWTPT